MHSPEGQITRTDDTFLSHKCKSFPKMHHSKAVRENKISVLFITSYISTEYFPANNLLKNSSADSCKTAWVL